MAPIRAPSPPDPRASNASDATDGAATDGTTQAAADATTTPPPCPPEARDCSDVPWPKSWTRYPIVLVHGAAGFDTVGPYGYWFGIADALHDAGFAVHVAQTDPFTTSEVRAAQLAAYVDHILACTCRQRVNLVAHSQGGLDARYLVSTLHYGDRVASLTTIATPHRGTQVADVALGLMPGPIDDAIDALLAVAGALYAEPEQWPDVAGQVAQMTTAGAEAFNAANPDDPAVAYYSWAGWAGLDDSGQPDCTDAETPPPPHAGPLLPVLWPTYLLLGGADGVANDGLVTVASARWGRFRGCIPADHLREVGQPAGLTGAFDHVAFFLDLAAFLQAEGF